MEDALFVAGALLVSCDDAVVGAGGVLEGALVSVGDAVPAAGAERTLPVAAGG